MAQLSLFFFVFLILFGSEAGAVKKQDCKDLLTSLKTSSHTSKEQIWEEALELALHQAFYSRVFNGETLTPEHMIELARVDLILFQSIRSLVSGLSLKDKWKVVTLIKNTRLGQVHDKDSPSMEFMGGNLGTFQTTKGEEPYFIINYLLIHHPLGRIVFFHELSHSLRLGGLSEDGQSAYLTLRAKLLRFLGVYREELTAYGHVWDFIHKLYTLKDWDRLESLYPLKMMTRWKDLLFLAREGEMKLSPNGELTHIPLGRNREVIEKLHKLWQKNVNSEFLYHVNQVLNQSRHEYAKGEVGSSEYRQKQLRYQKLREKILKYQELKKEIKDELMGI